VPVTAYPTCQRSRDNLGNASTGIIEAGSADRSDGSVLAGGERTVTVDEAADRFRRLLHEAGFNPARPNVAVAWQAFKRFAAEPVDDQTTELWFEAADGDPAEGFPAYFDFVRMVMHYPDDGAEWGEQITARFTAPPGVWLGLRGDSVQAEDVADLATWFEAVEASPSFKAGLAFDGWSVEIRIDGC
jgi:hypothetical protein